MKTLTANLMISLLMLPAFAQFPVKQEETYSYSPSFVAEPVWDDNVSCCSPTIEETPLTSITLDTKAIEAVAEDFYRNFNQKNVAASLKNTTSDWYFFGTAPGERYDKKTYRQGMEAAFRQSPHQQGITIKNRDITRLPGGQAAYVVETGIWPIAKTPVRFVSIYVKTPGGWKMRMNNVQITMTDDYLPRFNDIVSKSAQKIAHK